MNKMKTVCGKKKENKMNKMKTVKDIIISIDSEFDTISTNATCRGMDATELLHLNPEDFITESLNRFRDKKDSVTGKITIMVDRVFCQQQLEIMVFDTGFSVFTDHNVFSYRDGTLLMLLPDYINN